MFKVYKQRETEEPTGCNVEAIVAIKDRKRYKPLEGLNLPLSMKLGTRD